MRILLASATDNEISSTIQWLQIKSGSVNNNEITVAITGIGGTAAAYAITAKIRELKPQLVIQAGIAGSYKQATGSAETVFIKEDVFADLGASENGGLSDIFDLGLISTNDRPFTGKFLTNPDLQDWQKFGLRFVRGATVNAVSSSAAQVAVITNKYDPDIESMEGAALHYVCIMENIPFIQVRSISNFAGDRNKTNWQLKEAIQNLNNHLKKILEQGTETKGDF